MRREVVITGIGAVTPLGVGAAVLHSRWAAGDCAISDGQGACHEFDPADFLTAKEARRADRFTQLALAASDEALVSAGWADEAPYAPQAVGCIFGTGIGGIATIEANHTKLEHEQPVAPLAVPLMMSNAGAAAVAMRHRAKGPVYSVLSACAAGAQAIGAATRAIEAGEASAVITGGSEAALTPLARAAFAALDALSPRGVSQPFDARRDGFVMGEGAGALVLEDGEHARDRGASILARVRGYGATCDAYHLTAPDQEGLGQADAIGSALKDAELIPGEIDYVNAHGTSTPLNDRAETLAIKRALGDRAMQIPISSTKSAIGHLLGAAGAVEAIATILAARAGVVPPTIGLEQPDPELDLDYVPREARPLTPANGRHAIALSNSFGFGGHNAVLCLESQ
jgi:3-oxoacyl-[acyl-carrier-protein] synthase II